MNRRHSKTDQAQLALWPVNTERGIRQRLEDSTGRAVKLVLTDNATSLMSIREKGSYLAVRLHRMFLDAGEDVLAEIARYACTLKGETPRFWEFVNANLHRITARRRKARIRHEGRVYHLGDIFEGLNKEYFGGRLRSTITWGARTRRRARSRTLGSYLGSDDLIRVNPILDAIRVPRYYIEYVVYHEMLHAERATLEVGLPESARRRHDAEFKRREQEFRDYGRAMAFEDR